MHAVLVNSSYILHGVILNKELKTIAFFLEIVQTEKDDLIRDCILLHLRDRILEE